MGKFIRIAFWGTVKQIGDPSQVYICIDVDMLKPMLQGLYYGQQIVDEFSRCKRRQTAVAK